MEFTTLKAVSLAIFALIAAIQVISGIRAVRRVNAKRAAERKLEFALSEKLKEPELRKIIDRMEAEVAASGGDFDSTIYTRLLEEITQAAKELDLPERREVFEGVYQPSRLGRERYMRKIVENSKAAHAATG